jgi:hypothetical protein
MDDQNRGLQAPHLATPRAESTPPSNVPGTTFILIFWIVTVGFVIASMIGAFLLLANIPSCDTLYSTSQGFSTDCTVRHQYMFFTWGSIISATLFAFVLCALGVTLDVVQRIERRLISGYLIR